jgi:hypothetical protein
MKATRQGCSQTELPKFSWVFKPAKGSLIRIVKRELALYA